MNPGNALFFRTLRALLLTLLGLLYLGVAPAQERKADAKPDDYQAVLNLLNQGQLSQARAQAETYLATRPRDPQMRFIKGMVQQTAGQADDALATYLELTQDYPELPEPHNNLAVLLAARGKTQEARAELELALRANPGYATAHENLGDIYLQLASQSYELARQNGGGTALAPRIAGIRQWLSQPAPQTQPAPPLR